jgi:hypothetical protein
MTYLSPLCHYCAWKESVSMSQVFHPATNSFARGTIFGGVFILAAVAWAWAGFLRSDYVTQVNVARAQPVPFSHDHHVSGLGIDCRYCHTTVDKSPFAGMPATEICMGCHSQIWNQSPMLEPVRESFRTGQPLAWTRVYDLPDFVYFDHSIHIAKGVACAECHGEVERMPLMWKATTLHMEWCLDCHRRSAVTEQSYAALSPLPTQLLAPPAEPPSPSVDPHPAQERAPGAHPTDIGGKVDRHHSTPLPEKSPVPNQLTNCSVCHR